MATPARPSVDEKLKRLSKKEIKRGLKLFSFVKPYSWILTVGMVFLFLSSITVMAFPYFLPGLSELAKGETFFVGKNAESYLFAIHTRNELALLMFGILILQAIFSFFRVFTFSQVSERSLKDIRSSLFNKLVSLPYEFFEKNRLGEINSRINADISILQDTMSLTIAEFLRQALTLVVGISIVFWLSVKLTFLILLTVPPLMILALFLGKKIRAYSKKTQEALANANIIVEETFSAISMVKAYTNENFESKRYKTGILEVMKRALTASIFRGSFISFLIVGLFGILVFILWKASEFMATEDLVRFITYTVFIGASIAGLGDSYGRIMTSLGASERVMEILEMDSETHISPVNAPKYQGEISFNQVNFHYPTRTDIKVIDDLSFEIKKGEKIALVGSSGAGKSTIVQLLLRFYPIQSGSITVDGKNINELDVQELRANMAIVPQEVILFGGTIRENIMYGKLEATDEEIMAAAKKANATEFISRFPEGLETMVGERGVKLSGGQRQRIAIARAILKDPSILLLDEATSSLDAESEKYVQQALDNLMEGRTTIIIAHRLSTIRNVDRILVIDQGKIAESGKHELLSKKENGLYSNLLRLQFQLN